MLAGTVGSTGDALLGEAGKGGGSMDIGGAEGGNDADQGVCLQVVGSVDGKERELLRFECLDNRPHYHYDPENTNVRVMLDPTVTGNPLRWTRAHTMMHA
jgi:hypothetical protein